MIRYILTEGLPAGAAHQLPHTIDATRALDGQLGPRAEQGILQVSIINRAVLSIQILGDRTIIRSELVPVTVRAQSPNVVFAY